MAEASWLRAALALAAAATLPASAATAQDARDLGQRIIRVAEEIKPSVVHVEVIVKFNDRRNQATGSGVIASADGRILTNDHVVDRAEKVTVSVPGHRRKYPARIVGSDRQTDIALLRIEPDTPLTPAPFGSSLDVQVGQWVLAIGNPYGLDGTVSFGIVSAMGRNLEIPQVLNDFIQTDAMIDRGSSGGPLVDLDGRVIGINSRGQGRGIGFTIPIDTALEVMEQLEAGHIERGYLGITMQPLDRELADYFEVADATGVVVTSVVADSPAERAGLRPGDILTAFAGTPIEAEKEEDLGNLQRRVASVSPGEKVELELLRKGKRKRKKLEIGAQPKLEGAEEESDVGFHVQEITEQLARDHRLPTSKGVFVFFVAQGSPASEAGLRAGDVIERIDDSEVGDLDAFRSAMAKAEDRSRFLVRARRGEETKFLLFKPSAAPAPSPETQDGEAVPGEASF